MTFSTSSHDEYIRKAQEAAEKIEEKKAKYKRLQEVVRQGYSQEQVRGVLNTAAGLIPAHLWTVDPRYQQRQYVSGVDYIEKASTTKEKPEPGLECRTCGTPVEISIDIMLKEV